MFGPSQTRSPVPSPVVARPVTGLQAPQQQASVRRYPGRQHNPPQRFSPSQATTPPATSLATSAISTLAPTLTSASAIAPPPASRSATPAPAVSAASTESPQPSLNLDAVFLANSNLAELVGPRRDTKPELGATSPTDPGAEKGSGLVVPSHDTKPVMVPERSSLSHSVSTAIVAGQAGPEEMGQAFETLYGADLRPYVFAAFKPRDGQEELIVLALADSGAAASFIGRELVEKLHLQTRRLARPCEAVLADSRTRRRVEEVVDGEIRICRGQPATPISIFVLEDGPKHVIIGQPIWHAVGVTSDPAGQRPVFVWSPHARSEPDELEDAREPALAVATEIRRVEVSARPTTVEPTVAGSPEIILAEGRAAVQRGAIPTIPEERLQQEQLIKVYSVFLRHRAAFGPVDSKPADLPAAHFKLRPDAVPRRFQPRRFTVDDEEFVQGELKKWLDLDIIHPIVDSPWVSRLTVATRADGRKRLCVSYVYLNSQCVDEIDASPRICDMLHSFRGCKYLSAYDLSSGYLQQPVVVEDQPLLAFGTRSGVFTFSRMPFGTKGAPSQFQRAIAALLQGIPLAGNYLDDVAILGKVFDDWLGATDRWLTVAVERHIKIGVPKSHILMPELPYLGFLITPTGYSVDPSRLQGVRDLSPPQDKATLRSCLGLLNYFSSFVPRFADLAAPLYELLTKSAPYQWNDHHTLCLNDIRDRLLSHPLFLSHPDPALVFVLACDASDLGYGALLFQSPNAAAVDFGSPTEPATPMPLLAVLSHRWSGSQRRWSTTEKEAYAVISALQRLRRGSMLSSQHPVVAVVDHQNLLFWSASENRKLMRWWSLIEEFNVSFVHRPGGAHFLADAVSRCGFATDDAWRPTAPSALPAPTSSASVEEDVDGEALMPVAPMGLVEAGVDALEPSLRQLPHSLDGSIVQLEERPPDALLRRIFALAHTHPIAGHQGTLRTIQHVRQCVVWPGLDADIKAMVRQCAACQRAKAAPHPAGTLLDTSASAPFANIQLDHLGPLPKVDGMTYALCIIDRFARYVELSAVPDTAIDTTVTALMGTWVTRFGVPLTITSDGAFDTIALKRLCELLGTRLHLSVPRSPTGHACIERANRCVLEALRAVLHAEGTRLKWTEALPYVRFAINSAKSVATGFSPFEIVYGTPVRLPLAAESEVGFAMNAPEPQLWCEHLVQRLAVVHEQLRKAQAAAFEKAQRDYIQQLRGRPDRFEPGDLVLVRNRHPINKLSPKWEGPLEVISLENDVVCVVHDFTRDDTFRCHVRDMAHFHLEEEASQEEKPVEGEMADAAETEPGKEKEKEEDDGRKARGPAEAADGPATEAVGTKHDKLARMATREGEYHVEVVHEHIVDGADEVWFRVKWLGYEQSTADEWVRLRDCHLSPVVKEYVRKNKLKFTRASYGHKPH